MGTRDQYASAIIAEGQRQGIKPIGIVIALATVDVECDYMLPANPKVPDSLKYPHDRLGTDGLSVGLFQQQIIKGDNGRWWWADTATCMNPTSSARLFFERLKKWRYWETDVTPGWYAQEVQGSAYPDRYDKRMAEAQALYDRLAGRTDPQPTQGNSTTLELDYTGQSANHSSRYGAAVRLFCLHTEEGNSDAYQLHEWMKGHGVSYHYVAAKGVCIDHVDTDRASWSCLDANSYTINFVFAGSKAAMSRQQWLDRYSAEIDYAAKLFCQDADKYGPLVPVVLGRDYDAIGAGRNGGIDHSGVTYGLGIGDHTDVGPNFPWDVFTAAVERYAKGAPTTPVVNAIDEAAAANSWLGKRLTVGEQGTPDGRGRFAAFENGFIHWTPSTGARPQPTAIFQTWEELGYEGGPLGYPINYYTQLPGGVVQSFEGGTIYRQTDKPGYWVHGAIGNRWAREGFERSGWGWPISNEVPVEGGGAYQDFEGGRIAWAVDGTVGLSPKDGRDTVVPPTHT